MASRSDRRRRQEILCDFWYAEEIPELVAFSDYAAKTLGPLAKPLLSTALGRSLTLVWLGRSFSGIAPNWYRGGRLACVLQAFLAPRRVILLECIDLGLEGRSGLFRAVYLLLAKTILSPAMKRSVLTVQMLTDGERDAFARRYGLDPGAVHTIKWPLAGWGTRGRQPSGSEERYVFSSGRAACDWETLFRAAEGRDWKLKVVCGQKDLRLVERLNSGGRAQIYTEISREEHDKLLANAAVYALCLKEQFKSSGQVRLAACIEAGVPVVATGVQGLDGYLVDGVTGLATGVADPDDMGARIDELFQDPARGAELARRAKMVTQGYTRQDYFDQVSNLIRASIASRVASA
ncbi:glycosyltransferase [uncultured Caulobacter sp.]|uniref:glycosyltransferase n=1 Tax=uncultured Caulobacter sp. TaxID=158749 RepID=UPI00260EC6E0|nr:glycosyltransferase [uncultured Caulobacter sp.]